jgi:AcrR family transcriptional regulator
MTSTPSRAYDASGRQAAAEARRRHVVDTATRLFLDEGYGPTSIAHIAEEAGVSAPFVYATFGSKAGILAAVADVAVAGDHEEVRVRDRDESRRVQAASDGPTWVRLGAALTAAINERSAAVLHVVSSVAGADPAVAELLEKLTAGRRSDFETTIEVLPGMRTGLTKADLIDTVDVLTHWETWWLLVDGAGWTPERYESWLVEMLSAFALEG